MGNNTSAEGLNSQRSLYLKCEGAATRCFTRLKFAPNKDIFDVQSSSIPHIVSQSQFIGSSRVYTLNLKSLPGIAS